MAGRSNGEHPALFGEWDEDGFVDKGRIEQYAKDSEAVDRLVDGGTLTVDAARAIVGIDKADPSEDLQVAVRLEDRAEALKIIIDAFNQENRSNGAAKIRGTGYDNPYDRRYKDDADFVREGQRVNVGKANKKRDEAIKLLIAEEEIRHNDRRRGVPNDETEQKIAEYSKQLLDDFRKEYGSPGEDYRKKRNELVKKAQLTSDVVHGKRKPNGRKPKAA